MNDNAQNGAALQPPTTGAPVSAPAVPAVVPKPPLPFTGIDLLFALLSFVCGYLFIRLVLFRWLGLGVTLFTLFFCALALCYLYAKKMPPQRASWKWLALTLLSALQFSLFDAFTPKFFNFFFLLACAVYWLASAAGTRLVPTLGVYLAADFSNQFFRVPFQNYSAGFHIIAGSAKKKNENGKKVLAILCGAAACVPVLFIVVPLLMSADETFNELMRQIIAFFGGSFNEIFWQLPLAVLVGCYLFGLLYGNLHRRSTHPFTAETVDGKRKSRAILPTAAVITVLSLLCFVYLAFFAAQTASLFMAFTHTLPSGLTNAEYARSGFFELCGVAFVNLLVTLCVFLFSHRSKQAFPRPLRVFCAIISAQTLLLIVSAMSKMFFYIGSYGLTQLRVYTTWFMALLFVVFTLIFLEQIKSFNLIKALAVSFIILFMTLCYADTDGLIARYNISRYNATDNMSLITEEMTGDGLAGAAPVLTKLYAETESPELRGKLLECFLNNSCRVDSSALASKNLQRELARRAVGAALEATPQTELDKFRFNR